MESTSFENKRQTETQSYWNAIQAQIAPDQMPLNDEMAVSDGDKDTFDVDLFDFGERLPDEELAWRVYEKKSKSNEIYETIEPTHAPWWAKTA